MQLILHRTVIGADRLTPKLAREILEHVGYFSGTVFQDDAVIADGSRGTLEYRVYSSGRAKRFFHPYEVDLSPEYAAHREYQTDDYPF